MSRACDDAMREELLIEELGLRLYQAGLAVGGPSPSTRKRSKFWKAVAAEALRQMRWAYSEGWSDNSGDPHDDEDRFGEPSLAPKDWNP